jgi:hypothetical protein
VKRVADAKGLIVRPGFIFRSPLAHLASLDFSSLVTPSAIFWVQ